MAIMLVNNAIQGAGSGSGTITVPATAAGNFLVLSIVTQAAAVPTAVTDPAGNAMFARATIVMTSTSTWRMVNYFLPNISAGSGNVTVTFAGGTGWTGLYSEWSGCQTTSTLDSANTATDLHGSDTGTAALSIAATPSVNGSLIYCCGLNAGGVSMNPGAGFTTINNFDGIASGNAYEVQSVAASVQGSLTLTSNAWDITALIIKPFVPIIPPATTPFRRIVGFTW